MSNVLVNGHQEAPRYGPGLIALLNQKLNRRLGFVNPLLYNIDQTSGFRDINLGNNGAYTATYGWDPCTGNGTPVGTQLLQALQLGVSATVTSHAQQQKRAEHAAMSAR